MWAAGRNLAIDRTVNPLPDTQRMVPIPNSSTARAVACVMASVVDVSGSSVSVIRRSDNSEAQPRWSNASSARSAIRDMVATTFTGRGVVADDHPFSMGLLGNMGTDAWSRASVSP